jgi:hypothetical protein
MNKQVNIGDDIKIIGNSSNHDFDIDSIVTAVALEDFGAWCVADKSVIATADQEDAEWFVRECDFDLLLSSDLSAS